MWLSKEITFDSFWGSKWVEIFKVIKGFVAKDPLTGMRSLILFPCICFLFEIYANCVWSHTEFS